jgi:hypothetical protein
MKVVVDSARLTPFEFKNLIEETGEKKTENKVDGRIQDACYCMI